MIWVGFERELLAHPTALGHALFVARTSTGFLGFRRMSGAVVVVIVLLLCAAGALMLQNRAEGARLLRTPPDSISDDPALLRYAVTRGKPAFEQACARCHGLNLRGNSQWGFPDLVDDDWLYGTGRVSEIEHTILYGIRAGNSKGWNLASMPGFATPEPYKQYPITPLTPAQVDDVLQYVLSLRRSGDPGASVRGDKIFHDAALGMCADCHGFDAKGDGAIGAPNLTDATWLRGNGEPGSIRDTIERGLAQSCPAWIDRLPAATIRSIAVYVASAAPKYGASSNDLWN
jgi:cytochrome c oxidase cbb3-type subunit 3